MRHVFSSHRSPFSNFFAGKFSRFRANFTASPPLQLSVVAIACAMTGLAAGALDKGDSFSAPGQSTSPSDVKVSFTADGISFEKYEATQGGPSAWFASLCCPHRRGPETIPTSRLIGATAEGSHVTIHWASDHQPGSRLLRKWSLALGSAQEAAALADRIRARARPDARPHCPSNRVLVLLNPTAGSGDGRRVWREQVGPALESSGMRVEVFETAYNGHAVKWAAEWDLATSAPGPPAPQPYEPPRPVGGMEAGRGAESVDRIVLSGLSSSSRASEPGPTIPTVLCVGGDGTAHEAIQGLLSRPDALRHARHAPIALLPSGSGNALAHSMGMPDAASVVLAVVKGRSAPLDILRVWQPATALVRYSFLSLTYGVIANLDINSEPLRQMFGSARFTVEAVREVLRDGQYEARVWVVREGTEMPSPTWGPLAGGAGATRAGLIPSPGRKSRDNGVGDGARGAAPYLGVGGAAGSGLSAMQAVSDSLVQSGRTGPGPRGTLPSPWEVLPQSRFRLFALCNLRALSADCLMAPDASHADSGATLVVTTDPISRWRLAEVLIKMEKGEHLNVAEGAVQAMRVKALAIEPLAPDASLERAASASASGRGRGSKRGDAEGIMEQGGLGNGSGKPAPPPRGSGNGNGGAAGKSYGSWLSLDGEVLPYTFTVLAVQPGFCRVVVGPER